MSSTVLQPDRPALAAVRVLAASLFALGILHVIFGDALTRWLAPWADSPPGRPYWSRAIGGALVITSAWVLIRNSRRAPVLLLSGVLLLPVLTLHVPRALPSGELGNAWLGVFKWSTLAVAPLLIAARRPLAAGVRDAVVSGGSKAAPWLFAAFMMTSAILHVRHDEFVAQLMQPWMPWRMFWTYFAAVALAAGAIGLVVPGTRLLAAYLTSLMIFSWFLLVHVPRMLNDPAGPVGWSEMAESLAFSAMAFLLARLTRDSRRTAAGDAVGGRIGSAHHLAGSASHHDGRLSAGARGDPGREAEGEPGAAVQSRACAAARGFA